MIKRTVSILKFMILLTVGSVVLISCKDDMTFAAENKTTIDTMFLNRKPIMEAEIDSLCLVRNEQFYQEAVDSIMAARISEIETRLQDIKAKSGTR